MHCAGLVAQSCLILWNPVGCNPPGSSIHGDSLGRNTGVGCYALLKGNLPNPGIKLRSLHCGRFFTIFTILYQSSVQSLSRVWLFGTRWIAACQASLSITNSRSLLKLRSITSVILFNYLIQCRPLLLLPPIPPSITVFSNESTLCIMWPTYWSFSSSISPSNEFSGLTSFRMDCLDLLAEKSQESSPTPQFKTVNSLVLRFLYSPTLTSIHDYWKNHSFD